MARYIDADGLKKALKKFAPEHYNALINQLITKYPTADVVHIDEVFRLIAGHSNYHGDDILAALKCVTEGKEVNPVKPLPADVAEIKRGEWQRQNGGFFFLCSVCGKASATKGNFCHSCGADMRGEAEC